MEKEKEVEVTNEIKDEELEEVSGGTTPYAYLGNRRGSVPGVETDATSDPAAERPTGRKPTFF